MRAKWFLSIFVVLATLAMSACSSSSKPTSDGGGSTASGTTAAAGTGPNMDCKKGTGSPVKILSILDEAKANSISQPDVHAGIDARVGRINCEGGLGVAGSPVTVQYCPSNNDPNTVDACARNAVADKSFVAAINMVSVGDSAKILDTAGIPSIPANPYTQDYTAASSFSLSAGILITAGEAVMACQLGYKKVSELLIQVPAGAGITKQSNSALKSYGCPSIDRVVPVPPSATDMTAQLTAVSQGADAVLLDISTSQMPAVLKARQQLGIKTPFISSTGSATPAALKSAGSAANGLLLSNFLAAPNSSIPGARQFLADMEKAGETGEVGGHSEAAWLSVELLATGAEGLPTVSRSTVLKSLKGLTSFDGGGLIPAVDLSKAGPNPNYPRLFNGDFAPVVISDGKYSAVSKLPRFIPFFKGVG